MQGYLPALASINNSVRASRVIAPDLLLSYIKNKTTGTFHIASVIGCAYTVARNRLYVHLTLSSALPNLKSAMSAAKSYENGELLTGGQHSDSQGYEPRMLYIGFSGCPAMGISAVLPLPAETRGR